ncbi:DUF4878 domain-containing protein [Cohnella lupini]|uniref:Uncharacterized protein DUF4878 n=1 Tax=Cohnella lupini TaxID=1294267 RepID=A0A3D9IS95_9BACL|nr:DUF4878 domain-containing protein [Cohnella lupini]RED64653.1 uncharacterized protein DUF4878 [Cohnella lupini]
MNETAASRSTEQTTNLPELDPFAGFPPARTLTLSTRTKVFILLALAAGAILYLYLKFMAGDGSQSSPQKATEGFFQAAIDKDAKAMASFLYFASGEAAIEGMDKESVVQNWEKLFKEEPEIVLLQDFEVLDVQEVNDAATVVIKVKAGPEEVSGEQPYQLKKVKDKWFIDLFGQR